MFILGLGNKKYNFNLLESFANRIRNGWDDINLLGNTFKKLNYLSPLFSEGFGFVLRLYRLSTM
ncbi:hypothetical protein [Leptospira interrogans]|uniref:hypothetical protein n=1 Tax=Leptospira interrogans TaxID=173 RepID=UPI001F2AF7E2|nr:hypothetical protein [Leptospira interrogans]